MGNRVVTLLSKTAGRPINLGAPDSPAALGLTDGELDTITAGVLRIGDAGAGDITVSAAISPDNAQITADVTTGKGGAEISSTDPGLNSRHYGVSIAHQLLETQLSAAAPGYVFTTFACDPGKSVAAGSSAE